MDRLRTAALLGLLGVFAMGPFLSAADAPAARIPWNDSKHRPYFNYQIYLTAQGLTGENQATWDPLEPAVQKEKLEKGEDFLNDRLQDLMAHADKLNEHDAAMVKGVWGQEMGSRME